MPNEDKSKTKKEDKIQPAKGDDVQATALEVDVADEEGRQFRISIQRLKSKLGPKELELNRSSGRILKHSPDNMT